MQNNKVIPRKYLEVETGNVPIILSCPHGGYKKPENIPDIEKGARYSDRNTLFLAKRLIYMLKEKGFRIYYILSKIHRGKVDLNRPPGTIVAFNQSSDNAREFHYIFHDQIKKLSEECVLKYKKCLFIDFHGFTKPSMDYCDIIFGNIFSNTLSIKSNETSYWGLNQLINEFSKHFTLDDGLGVNDINVACSGGYITHQFYRKEKINAVQIEIADNIRKSLKLANIFVEDFVNALIKCLT